MSDGHLSPGERPPERANYITPAGYAVMRARYELLFGKERPALVEVISWAAGNGDRSENGDYIYGRKKLREIDRELGYLSRRMKSAKIVDPALQTDRSKVYFGATVTIVDEHDVERTVTLVGEDETDSDRGHISWRSPMAHALKGATVGDVRRVTLPGGVIEQEILAISYPEN